MASATDAPRPPWPLRLLDALAAHPRLVVGLAALLPFLHTVGHPPIQDDGWQALDNPLTYTLANAGRIFREPFGFAGGATLGGPYRPITTLSFALNYAAHGRWPPGYHLVNLALHALASLLVVALARRLATAQPPPQAPAQPSPQAAAQPLAQPPELAPAQPSRVALLAGLLFALHPAHVEVVATIFGRSEALSTCLALGALLLALDRHRAPWRLPAALGLLVAGVLSKESAVVTPGLFAVVAFALPGAAGLPVRPGLRAGPPRRALREVVLVALLLLAALVPYLVGRGATLAVPAEARWFPAGTPGWQVALTMSRVLGEYLRILAFPTFLGGDFAYAARLPTLDGPTVGLAVASAAWLATLAAVPLLLRRAPLVSAGLAWIFLPLLPVLHLVPVGVLMAERLLYLSSAGFCLAAAAALAGLLPAGAGAADPGAGRRAGLVAAAALGLGLLLGARSVGRTLDWRSDLVYWRSELEKAPLDPVVNNNLGVAYLAVADYPHAVERLQVVRRLHPAYWRAAINLGIALGELGRREPARRAFQQALAMAPESTEPRFYYARWLRKVGEGEEALRLLAEARALRPDEVRLPLLQGEVLLELGRLAEARSALEQAAALDPKDGRIRALLAQAGRAPAGP